MAITEKMMKNIITIEDLTNENSDISLHVKICTDALDTALSKLTEAKTILEAFLTEASNGGMTYEQAEEKFFSPISELVEEAIYECEG